MSIDYTKLFAVRDVDEPDHSEYSASGSKRWSRCPGSMVLERFTDEPPVARYSAEGTLAHSICEECLDSGYLTADTYIGETHTVEGHVFTIDVAFAAACDTYISNIRSLGADAEFQIYEGRVYYGEALDVADDRAFGTGDAITLGPGGRTLHIDDLKFGKGVQEWAENNTQLLLYAVGAYDELMSEGVETIEEIVLTIHQPRLGHLDSWTVTPEEMDSHVANLAVAANQCDTVIDECTDLVLGAIKVKIVPDLEPSTDACRWCRAKSICPKLQQEAEEISSAALAKFSKIEDDGEELAKLLAKADVVEMHIKDLREVAYRRAGEGRMPHYKLVPGRRGNRTWVDSSLLLNDLRDLGVQNDLMYDTPTVLSPAKMEKALADMPDALDVIKGATVQADGKPVLVSANDPRSEIMVGEELANKHFKKVT